MSGRWNVGEFHRPAVRSVAVRVSPFVLAANEGDGIEQSLFQYKTLQRCLPVMVIPRSVVRFAAIDSGLEFGREGRRPFLPRKSSCFRQINGEREGLRLPGLSKYGTAFIARQRRELLQTIGNMIRHAQGSPPTDRRRPNRVPTRDRPTARER